MRDPATIAEAWRRRLAALAVAACAAAVYANSLGGGFVWDDKPIIIENPLVRGPARLSRLLASSYWGRGAAAGEAGGGLYRPLAILSYALNYRLSGPEPFWFHALNVLLHGANSLLLLGLALRLGLGLRAGLAAGLAFAVLPVHAEAVSWVVGRAELMAAFFCLASWNLLLGRERPGRIGWGLAFYGLALLSKESAAPFPAALVLSDLMAEGPPGKTSSLADLARRRGLVWSGLIGVLALYLSWRSQILGSALRVGRPYFSDQPFLVVALTMARYFFLGWLWPMATGLGLCPDRSRPSLPDAGPGEPLPWLCLAAILFLLAAASRAFLQRRDARAFAGLVFFAFASVLGNILLPMEIIGADRILYLPSLGFCLLLGLLWDGLSRRRALPRRVLLAAGLACLAWWGRATMTQNRIWRSEDSLWAATGACAPKSPRVIIGLGVLADSSGRRAEARAAFSQALALDPTLVQAAYNLGKSYYEGGERAQAKSWLGDAHRRWPRDRDTLCLLGLVAEQEKDFSSAISHYRRALEIDPSHLESRRNLGLLLYRLDNAPAALRELEEYLRAAPPGPEAREIEEFLRKTLPPAGGQSPAALPHGEGRGFVGGEP